MESTTKRTTETRIEDKSPLDRLREFATATADINPHLLSDIERGWVNPHGGLMEFVERVTPNILSRHTANPIEKMNHKEMTAHIRARIKVAKIKACVSKYTSCGFNWIRVSVTAHDLNFTPCEQNAIKIIAQANGLTGSRGLPLIMDSSVNPQEFHFLAP